MDLMTTIGVTMAILCVAIGGYMEHVTLGMILQPSAMLIIFGGTIGATIIHFGTKEVMSVGKYIKIAFVEPVKKPIREEIHDRVQHAPETRLCAR